MSTIKKPEKNEKIQVVVRCRPMNDKERAKGYISVVKIHPDSGGVEIYDPKCAKLDQYKIFRFDAVYDWNCTQEEIYNDTIRPLISDVLNGFNATIFAYGQTGTGKTYTMEGDKTIENAKGIIPRTFDQIFEDISRSQNFQYLLSASYIEIYQEEVRDLLATNSKQKLEIRENEQSGVFLSNLTNIVCRYPEQIVQMLEFGNSNRTTRATDMNEKSSRSHAIFTITVEMSGLKGPLENTFRIGKLNLVDLAGSERQNKTNSEGTRLKEASKINLSLTALGNVISALADGKGTHIPYRDSKLTRLLRNSLGGNSKTLMVANIGPASYNYDESLNTLRYSSRARNIKNEPHVNEDPVDALLRVYQEELRTLKIKLAERDAARKERLKKRDRSDEEEKIVPYMPDYGSRRIHSVDGNAYLYWETHEKEKSNKMEIEIASLLLTESEAEKKDIAELTEKIQKMENNMLRGSTNILDHTNEQQKVLEAQAVEIRKRKQREQEMQQMLEMEEETAEEIKGDFSNLQQEVESKSKRLKRIHMKLIHFTNEIRDIAEEFNTDRREIEITQNDLLRELKLALLVIDNFIPNEEKRRLLDRLFYDEELDTWKIMPESEPAQVLAKPQCSGHMRKSQPTHTATSQFGIDELFSSRLSSENRQTFRAKREDILGLDLVSPLRTTRNYESPKMSPVLKSIFDAALQVEEDIDVDASNVCSKPNLVRSRSGLVPRSSIVQPCLVSKVLKSASSTLPPNSTPVYPKARGWVPK